MKKEELSVGDYVQFNGSPYVIEEISRKGWVHMTDPVHDLRVQLSTDYILDFIEGVPMTSEILEANGFEFVEADKLSNVRRSMCHLSRMNGCYRYINKTKKGFLIDFAELGYSELHKEWQITQMFGNEMVIDAGRVTYVHQLQHAMRLCGIDKEIKIKLEE